MPAVEPNQEYQVSLPEFEGPLDLLLHLVKRHELSIVDIPIAFVTEKYIEYLELMRALNVDVAGEYLLMAATLCHLKSRELLPKTDDEVEEDFDDEEEGDTKEALIRRLLEYQRYKKVAAELGDRPALGRQVFGRGAPTEPADVTDRPLAEVGTFALINALAKVLQRAKVRLTYDVVVDRISITDRINEIVDQLDKAPSISFTSCFPSEGEITRHDIVVTFLAILELARLHMIRVLQHEDDGEIYLSRRGDLRAVDHTEDTYS